MGKIVYVTHHIPIKEFIYEKQNDPLWGIFNAYQGSQELGKIALSNQKVKLIIGGHSHIPDIKHINQVICSNVSNEFQKLTLFFINYILNANI